MQQYIDSPFLIDGLKFDLRLYVLVKSCDPLQILFYQEGLARFCTTEYEPPNKRNVNNLFMHLTNYAVNKKNQSFQQNQAIDKDDSGHKRSFTSILNYMKSLNLNTDKLLKDIKDIIVKTICCA